MTSASGADPESSTPAPFLLRATRGGPLGRSLWVSKEMLVGRGPGVAFLTEDAATSARHCAVRPAAEGVIVTDLQSTNGTFVNAKPVTRPTLAMPGSTIRIGSVEFTVLQLLRRRPAPTGQSLALLEAAGETRILATGDDVTIGRDRGCDIVLDDPTVSLLHASWTRRDGRWAVEDEAATNGTFVNGHRVLGRVNLRPGDVVRMGHAPTTVTVVDLGAFGSGPDALRIALESHERELAVKIAADPGTTIADLIDAAVAYLGQDPDAGWILYRPRDGQILHPGDRWTGAGSRRGDLHVLGRRSEPLPAVGQQEMQYQAPVRLIGALPRTVAPAGDYIVELPQTPESASMRGQGLFWRVFGGLGAIVAGVVMAVLRPSFAIFGYLTATMGLVSLVSGILADRSRRRFRVRQFRAQLQSLDNELDEVIAAQRALLHALSPSDSALLETVRTVSSRLWERRRHDRDLLRLRLGTGTRLARIAASSQTPGAKNELGLELKKIMASHTVLTDCPVVGPGPEVPIVGLVGDRSSVTMLANRMIIEAAVTHPPSLLRVWILADNPAWDWTRWIPHTAATNDRTIARSSEDLPDVVAALARQLNSERTSPPATDAQFHLVVVSPLVSRHPSVARLLERDLEGRVQVLVLAGHARELPGGVGTIVDVDERGNCRLSGTYEDAPVGEFRSMGITREMAQSAALELAPLVEGVNIAGSRAPTGLIELISGSTASGLDVGAVWDRNDFPVLSTPIGTTSDGTALLVSFRADGPHGFVAGTTGSGKSELLQTLLTGLALIHPPSRLNLFLIDFKGRATFGPLADLPHVVGLLTDLEQDPSLAQRAFTALDAEIDRRKRLLDEARVPNVIEYEASSATDREPIPNLVVVIDELQKLIEREPDVKRRLDTVASQGRSLGVHLLLATQSPAGVITPTIEANTNLWLCLRVATPSESTAILGRGRDDAARLANLPGSGFVRRGHDQDIVGFRSARIARPLAESDGAKVEIVAFADEAGLERRPALDTDGSGHKEIDLVVDKIVREARARSWATARQLWLPPLPSHLDARQLSSTRSDARRLVARVGLADLPAVPAQICWTIDLTAAGNALVLGVLGSGKTTALLQIGADLAGTHSPADMHLYGLEAGGGSLLPLRDLPHTAAIVGAGDQERVDRLLRRLVLTVAERRRMMTEGAIGDFLALRSAASVPLPWIVVLVDDYISFREVADSIDHGRPIEELVSLLRNGPSVGVHIVLSASQSVDLRSSHLTLFGSRLLLRLADTSEYYQIGFRTRAGELPDLPPGRGFTNDATVVQVAHPGDTIGAVRDTWPPTDRAAAPKSIKRLPAEVRLAELSTPLAEGPGVVLGLGGDEVEPIVFDLDAAGGVLAVLGSNQSGRTTALRTILDSFAGNARPPQFAVVATRRGSLRDGGLDARPGCIGIARSSGEIAEVLERFAASPAGSLLVIDDAEQLQGALPGLDAILRSAPDQGHMCVIAARNRDIQGVYEPWSKYLLSLRTALLLQPTNDDAFLVGTKLPGGFGAAPVGRGFLVSRGQSRIVQVARSI